MTNLSKLFQVLCIVIFTTIPALGGEPTLADLARHLKKFNVLETIKLMQFDSYVKALGVGTSPLGPKHREYFIKKALKLKIYTTSAEAEKAFQLIAEGRHKLNNKRLIGFTANTVEPKLLPQETLQTNKHGAGFTLNPNPLPANNTEGRVPGKIGFMPSASVGLGGGGKARLIKIGGTVALSTLGLGSSIKANAADSSEDEEPGEKYYDDSPGFHKFASEFIGVDTRIPGKRSFAETQAKASK